MSHKSIKLDGLNFTRSNVLKFATIEDWLLYAEDNKHWFEGDENRTEKLSEVWATAHGRAIVDEIKPEPKKRAPRKVATAETDENKEDDDTEIIE